MAHPPTTHSFRLKSPYEVFFTDKKFLQLENYQEYDLFQLRIARRQLNFRKEAVYLILTIKLISSFVGFCGREVIDASVILATWKLKFVLIDLSDIIKLNHFAQFHRIRIV